jgi:DNA-binding transcriptional LysR family regulator
VELRDIEIFLALAEELHFGRTAERLHVSQARISQAITQQERRLGGALFDRSNRRRIRLTPLGRQLRDDLRPVYAGLRGSLERARLAAQGITAVLSVGMLPINVHDLRAYWDTFRARHPTWRLRIQHPAFNDPFGALRRGDVDVLVAWLPIEESDLTVGPILYAEPRVLAVGTDHELARRTSVSLDMVSDFQHPDVLPGPHGAVRDPARHRLSAGSRPGAPAVRPRLAQRSRNRARPGLRPGRPRSGSPYRHRRRPLTGVDQAPASGTRVASKSYSNSCTCLSRFGRTPGQLRSS